MAALRCSYLSHSQLRRLAHHTTLDVRLMHARHITKTSPSTTQPHISLLMMSVHELSCVNSVHVEWVAPWCWTNFNPNFIMSKRYVDTLTWWQEANAMWCQLVNVGSCKPLGIANINKCLFISDKYMNIFQLNNVRYSTFKLNPDVYWAIHCTDFQNSMKRTCMSLVHAFVKKYSSNRE